MTDRVVLYKSDESARRGTIDCWRDINGTVFFKEADARYSSCTHWHCDCGAIVSKRQIICTDCEARIARELYDDMPKKQWDGASMVYSMLTQRYYSEPSEALNDLGITKTGAIKELMLVICEPVYPTELDVHDYYIDDLPEDGEVPYELVVAAREYNKVVRKCGPLSWWPGDYALDFGDENA